MKKVINPSHYTASKIEPIDFMKAVLTEEEFTGYLKGNIIKYVSRERLKNGDEDKAKALFYMEMLNGIDPRKRALDNEIAQMTRDYYESEGEQWLK